MDLEIERGGDTVRAVANISKGWRRLKNTFGFCEESRVELQRDETLRIQAAIHAWPNFLGSRLAEFPPTFGLLRRDWGVSELRGDTLLVAMNVRAVRDGLLAKSGLT